MSSSNTFNTMLFNLAGGAVLLTAAGYMITSYVTTPAVMPCASRFPTGVKMTFEGPNGKPLTPIELQGRSGSREWGLLKNAKVVADSGQPGGVLEVKLAPTEDEDKATQNGVAFTWQRHELASATAACLSYHVSMPDRFAFNEPGFLPGLFGAADITQIDELEPQDGFATRLGWAQAGDMGVDVRIPASAGYWETPNRKWIWPANRWVKVEQEVRLNTPGQDNGVLRVWIDGALTINRDNVAFRTQAQSVISGVVSDIGYARTLSDVAAIKVSPFVLQWQ